MIKFIQYEDILLPTFINQTLALIMAKTGGEVLFHMCNKRVRKGGEASWTMTTG